MAKKILVIGGTGTMGTPLVNALFERGYEITVVCRRKVSDNRSSIRYLFGDAKDPEFISGVVSNIFDVIVDFCWYSSKEFSSSYKVLLEGTSQYVCLSSAAVYSDVSYPKDEFSPRYLEIDPPEEGSNKYNWYCYEKARIEDILINSEYKNWTIVRPGTTMNLNHFGFGHEWNDNWILRILQGKKVIIARDMLDYKFSLSSGHQLVGLLLLLIDNPRALNEIYNLTSTEVYSWRELLDMYIELFSHYGFKLKPYYVESKEIINRNSNPLVEYWYKRARLLDRVFDCHKIYSLVEGNDNMPSLTMKDYLDDWINQFIENNDRKVLDSKIWHTAWIDRITRDITARKFFYSKESYYKYLLARFVPSIYNKFYYIKK